MTQMTLMMRCHTHFCRATMSIKFDRPVGAPADLKELEYISALHQTCSKLRQDASIDGE